MFYINEANAVYFLSILPKLHFMCMNSEVGVTPNMSKKLLLIAGMAFFTDNSHTKISSDTQQH